MAASTRQSEIVNRHSITLCGALAALVCIAHAAPAVAQISLDHPPGIYQPLNQRTPIGTTAQWMAFPGKATPPYFQPVSLELPTTGQVIVFGPTPQQSPTVQAPGMVALEVGHLYRLKISNMPEFPGVELFPTVELLDRLHPPPGSETKFPIPVQLTFEEIELALAGRLVTKVLYLEQPDLAPPRDQEQPMRVITIPNSRNLLAEADLAGRPMLILRLGSRIPNDHGPDPAFYGKGTPAGAAVMLHHPPSSP